MDTDSLKVHVKTNDTYKNIAEDVETGFDISNFEIDRPLSIGKNKKVIELMKGKLGEQTMKNLLNYIQTPTDLAARCFGDAVVV